MRVSEVEMDKSCAQYLFFKLLYVCRLTRTVEGI